TAGAFTLLDDDLDRGTRGREVGHGGQLGALEDLSRRLRLWRSDEDVCLAITVDEVGESSLDAAVEMADRVPFLGTAGDLGFVVREGAHVPDRAEALGIAQRHPL